MTIQEPGMCSNFFHSVSDTASNAAEWCGKTVQSIGSTIGTYAEKAAELARPHFDKMKEFVSENRGPIILVVGALAIGAVAYAIINSFSAVTLPRKIQPLQQILVLLRLANNVRY